MKNKSITVTENVSLITLSNIPSDISFLSFAFETVAKAGINIDMISMTAPKGEHTDISFTIDDNDLSLFLPLIPLIRNNGIEVAVSSDNCKISVAGDFMRDSAGVAARVFTAAASVKTDIRLITTSETDISLLLTKDAAILAKKAIEKAFE